MSSKTRSSPEIWMLGHFQEDITSSGLPTNKEVLRKFMFHHQEKGLCVGESAKVAVNATVSFWNRARIPTQRIDSAIRKFNKLLKYYHALKANRLKQHDCYRAKEGLFKADLDNLFDISAKNWETTMSNEEDKEFLRMQQIDTTSCSMAGIDKTLAQTESRKRMRSEAFACQMQRSATNSQQTVPLAEILSESGSSTESSSYESEDNFNPALPSTSTPKIRVVSSEVAASLDRTNVTDRNAMFIMGAYTQAMGYNLNDVVLSRNTIKRSRIVTRKETAASIKAQFTPKIPLLLHWDGKLLIDASGQGMVDRIAILVTGGTEVEQLLGVPKIGRGTGQAQADSCLNALEEWKLKDKIQGLVFDTTASNTGWKMGACTLIEKALGREVVWIACRHHIFEVVLSKVFLTTLGQPGGPEMGLFQRFKKGWPFIDVTMFHPVDNVAFNGITEKLREDMQVYYGEAMKTSTPRADYKELLQLCYIFLGGTLVETPHFRAPGAMHNARWMARAIYCLKIFLFKDQVKLTSSEQSGLENFAYLLH